MKYGETLRQRSIAAWSHYNIDYDDIKFFIKEHTTPGKGKTVSVPGRGDEKLLHLEADLFRILEEQHHRIDLFVKSKAGEVQRRLDHTKTQLQDLSRIYANSANCGIPIRRLERYGKLESDVLKAGDEIRALARFSGAQRTAFRKLLKKFKKWTGSTALEERFREEILNDPKSFTKLDLGPLLDDYSETLQRIRSLSETRHEQTKSPKLVADSAAANGTSEARQLQSALKTGSRVGFDTAIATVPLGDSGEIANYFVHPESIVELQILLLQRMQYFTSRSRSNSAATPISPANGLDTGAGRAHDPDYFMLIVDNLDRFAHEQSALTVDEREHAAGVPPQKARTFARWNEHEEAFISARIGKSNIAFAGLKRKRIDSFFGKDDSLSQSGEVSFANDDQALTTIRDELTKDPNICPLFQISTCRSRFTGIGNGSTSFSLATLDTAISIQKAGKDAGSNSTSHFPFAVLQVRVEGTSTAGIISFLDRSHLVERVRGFSLEYHALWQMYRPSNIAPPFWMPILSRDIRKLPPPAVRRTGSVGGSGEGSSSDTRRSISTPNSLLGITDTTTAVETERPSSSVLDDLPETQPTKSLRKKRRRSNSQRLAERQQKYWSEYDHPEDGGGGDAYVIFIDPNEKSTIERLFDKLGELWSRSSSEEEALLPSPTSPMDDDTSDEEQGTSHWQHYGTTDHHSQQPHRRPSHSRAQFLPPMTIICLVASIALLVVAYILKTTSKHKYATKVDAGIVFAIACSIAFAVIGFGPLLSRRNGSWTALVVAATVLILDAVVSGYLLAWILG